MNFLSFLSGMSSGALNAIEEDRRLKREQEDQEWNTQREIANAIANNPDASGDARAYSLQMLMGGKKGMGKNAEGLKQFFNNFYSAPTTGVPKLQTDLAQDHFDLRNAPRDEQSSLGRLVGGMGQPEVEASSGIPSFLPQLAGGTQETFVPARSLYDLAGDAIQEVMPPESTTPYLFKHPSVVQMERLRDEFSKLAITSPIAAQAKLDEIRAKGVQDRLTAAAKPSNPSLVNRSYTLGGKPVIAYLTNVNGVAAPVFTMGGRELTREEAAQVEEVEPTTILEDTQKGTAALIGTRTGKTTPLKAGGRKTYPPQPRAVVDPTIKEKAAKVAAAKSALSSIQSVVAKWQRTPSDDTTGKSELELRQKAFAELYPPGSSPWKTLEEVTQTATGMTPVPVSGSSSVDPATLSKASLTKQYGADVYSWALQALQDNNKKTSLENVRTLLSKPGMSDKLRNQYGGKK